MKNVLLILLCFTQILLFGQTIEDTLTIKNQLTESYQKALELHKQKKYDESNEIILEIYKLSDKIGQVTSKFSAQTLRASALLQTLQYDKLDKHYAEMEKVLSKVNLQLQCFFWYNKAQYLFETNRIVEAETSLNVGFKLLDTNFKDYYNLFVGYNLLKAKVYVHLKNYKQARLSSNILEDSLNSVSFNLKNKKLWYFNLYNFLGGFSKDVQDYYLANVYYEKALDYNQDPKYRDMVKYNLAHLAFMQEKYDMSMKMLDSLIDTDLETSTRLRKYFTKCLIYEAKDDHTKFISTYKIFLKSVKKENFQPLLIHVPLLTGIKKYYEKGYSEAKIEFEKAVARYEKESNGFGESIVLAKKYIAFCKAATQNDITTAEDLKQIFNKQDSLQNLRTSTDILKLHVKYQSEQISSQNKILTQDQLIKQQEIFRQKILIFLGLVALLVISTFLWYHRKQLKIKQKQNAEITYQNDKIRLLNRELNHRVKNNLAFMTSLLEMQGRRTENIETKQALQESESRLRAITLVHSQLFRRHDEKEINLKSYMYEIANHLREVFNTSINPIQIITEIVDYNINAEDAMRMGLIVNELITNSVKHSRTKEILLSLTIKTTLNSEGKLTLEYYENGKTIREYAPPASSQQNSNSLGLKLIELLKQQLGDQYIILY